MYVHGPSSIHPAQPLQGPNRVQQPVTPGTSQQTTHGPDKVEISHKAELVSRVHDLPDIRADRVAEIRQQIEAGTYETEEKLEKALDGLMEEIFV